MTVIVPTFRSGPGIQRVFDSIDEVSLPPGQLEVIFADDGSGDDTVERLHEFARSRPHVRVVELENSGWPSRPRNVAIEQARGEYLLFMDHDDSLYPDALRRAYEFAVEHDIDVVSPKESKTNDVWWATHGEESETVPDIRAAGIGINGMMPMVPHKLYRRQLFLDHDIRFPEGGRVLWEDWYVNIPSYRYGRVAMLEDFPLYLWHASTGNTSHTFDPSREEFWDRLGNLFEHIETTLAGKEYADDRLNMIANNLCFRAVHRLARQLTAPERGDASIAQQDAAAEQMAFARSAQLIRRYGRRRVVSRFPRGYRALAWVIRCGRLDRARSLQLALESITASVTVVDAGWSDGKLWIDVETRWSLTDTDRVSLVPRGRRLRLDFGPELDRLVPRQWRISDPVAEMRTSIAVRSRSSHVTWVVPVEPLTEPALESNGHEVTFRSRAVVDCATDAGGEPLSEEVWDLRMRCSWLGLDRRDGVLFRGEPRPALLPGRGAVAYANDAKRFSLDLSGAKRTVTIDGRPQEGPSGPVESFRTRLTSLAVHADQSLHAPLAALTVDSLTAGQSDAAEEETPEARHERIRQLANAGLLSTQITVDEDGGWLTGSARLVPGEYTVWADRAGTWKQTRYALTVDEDHIAHFVRR
nr:glycosyltransferase family 2 protein [Flexivirga caeni]